MAERLSSDDAWIFPIVRKFQRRLREIARSDHSVPQIGSVALFGIYLIVEHFGKEWLNWLLAWYFSLMGALCVWKVRARVSWIVFRPQHLSQCAVSFTRLVMGNERWRSFDKVRIFILKGPRGWESVLVSMPITHVVVQKHSR